MHGARAITIAGVVAPGIIVVLNVHSLAGPSFRAAGRAGTFRTPINDGKRMGADHHTRAKSAACEIVQKSSVTLFLAHGVADPAAINGATEISRVHGNCKLYYEQFYTLK